MITKATCCCAVVAAALLLSVHSSSARTLHVGTCTSASRTYATVQGAVDAAADGDAVAICPGTYPEQVTITKSVSLKKTRGMASPQIVVPAGGFVQNTTLVGGMATAAQILVAPSTTATVNISGLIVDAADNNNTDCNLEMIGIYYKGAGGRIANNTVQNQIGPVGHQNCQNGIGINVENQTVGTGEVTIVHNSVKNFDKNGIVMRYAGSVGKITRNTVTGLGETDIISQNGIQLRDNAAADVVLNTLSGFVYTPETFGSAAIILYNVSAAGYQRPPLVQRNNINGAQFGVVLDGANGAPGNLVQVSGNTIFDVRWGGVSIFSEPEFTPAVNGDYVHVFNNKITNTTVYDGIDVCGNNNTIERNTVANSNTESAIHLDALCEQANGDLSGADNTVSGNRITSACVGILSGQPDGANTIGDNKFLDVANKIMFDNDDYTCSTAARQQQKKVERKSSLRALLSPGRH